MPSSFNIGVLSGADDEATLRAAGADVILGDITELLGDAAAEQEEEIFAA